MATNHRRAETESKSRRNYRYEIPLDDDRAMRKVRVAEKVKGRWITTDPKEGTLGGIVVVQTRDKKGPISGLSGDYMKSAEWESPFGPGKHEGLEIRNARGGGTRVKGYVWTCDALGQEVRAPVDFTVAATPTEVKADLDDTLYPALHYELDEVMEEINHERVYKHMDEDDMI